MASLWNSEVPETRWLSHHLARSSLLTVTSSTQCRQSWIQAAVKQSPGPRTGEKQWALLWISTEPGGTRLITEPWASSTLVVLLNHGCNQGHWELWKALASVPRRPQPSYVTWAEKHSFNSFCSLKFRLQKHIFCAYLGARSACLVHSLIEILYWAQGREHPSCLAAAALAWLRPKGKVTSEWRGKYSACHWSSGKGRIIWEHNA